MRSRFFSQIGIKRIKFMPAANILQEGSYTTYSKTSITSIVSSITMTPPKLFFVFDSIDLLLYSFYKDNTSWNRYSIYNLSSGAEVYTSPVNTDYIPLAGGIEFDISSAFGFSELINGGCSVSAMSYIMFIRNDLTTMEVWKSGSRIYTYDLSVDFINEEVFYGAISPNGKYIIIILHNTIIDGLRAVLFTGT